MNTGNQSRNGTVGRAIIIVCGVLMAGGIGLQWRIIRTLRADNEALRLQQQQLVAAAGIFDQSAAVASQGNAVERPKADVSPASDELRELPDEKRELLRLRNEVHQLRARVTQNPESPRPQEALPVGTDDVPLPTAPIPRAELTPEWKGMEQHATNKYARALERLGQANTEMQRFFALGDAAKLSFAFGQTDRAKTLATEVLALGEKFKGEPWSNGSGDAVHAGNLVLGRLSLEAGALDDAKRYLLEAGASTGSPVLGSFGPNMSLARELLERGERETVLQYFDACAKFWKTGKLQQWTEEVNLGRIPNFGANLIY